MESQMPVSNKIFYIGFQRVGTKSFGNFMRGNGFEVASWRESDVNNWSDDYFEGKFSKIVRSEAFQNYQVFEDAPWFQPFMVKYLYHELPESKFVC
jgi:hypothetical protein